MEVGSTNSFTSYNNLILANCSEGVRFNGRMSAVRKFFCMFVTFDFLFVALFWVLCVLIPGTKLIDVWNNEVVDYSFSKSTVDVPVSALFRFLLLLLFYGTIQINHWWFIVLSTSSTCLFVGTKAFLYTWPMNTSRPFEVMLFLISFIIAWAELWFIEVRVLTQERHALHLMQGVPILPNILRINEGHPIIGRVSEYLNHASETATNFYSPLESPFGSENDPEDGIESVELTSQEREWIKSGEEGMHRAYEVLHSGGWMEEKRISSTDKIYSKGHGEKKTIYKLEAVIDCNPTVMFNDCITNFENIPNWNRSVVYCKVVQVVNSQTDITYNVAAEGPGGIISSRDFVSVRCWTKMGDSYLVGGDNAFHPTHPPIKKYVRGENGPNCVVFNPYHGDKKRCLFEFLLDVNLKGWIPSSIVSHSMVNVLAEFRDSIVEHAKSVKQPSGR